MLLNSILANLPIYQFSFYKAPKIIVKEVIRIQRELLWGGVDGQSKMCWLSWEKYVEIKPKEAYELSIMELLIWCC